MTNAEKFEQTFGFRPDTTRVPPFPQCYMQKCKQCKYYKTNKESSGYSGCNPLLWWSETYKRPYRKKESKK